jgi:predicted MFS family arabinose efflux permease
MVTAAVHPKRRGSFMSINASVQQFSAGIAAFGSGLIISKTQDGSLIHFGTVGLIAAVATLVCIAFARRLQFVEGSETTIADQTVVMEAEVKELQP